MANVITLANLSNYAPYQGPGFHKWISDMKKGLPPTTVAADAMTFYVSNALTTTAVAIKAAAGKLHGVYVLSNGALGYLSLWNVAQGSVTVGTTSQDFAIGFSATAGQDVYANFGGSSNGTAPNWATAITAAVATTARGNSAVGTLPTVWIAYE